MRSYPALDVSWPAAADPESAEGLVLAIIDEDHPLSLEERTDGFRVYFTSSADRDRAHARINAFLPAASSSAIDVPDEDWAARSQAGLAAVIVDRVIVSPPWDVRRDTDSVTVVIQPSMGFGTGHHASTRLCLALLQRLPLTGASVVDVGTGSGVLAIAAALLGAGRVVAIDSDPDALQSASENVALNDVGSRVELRLADLSTSATADDAPFDVALANLTGGLLIRQAATLHRLVAPGGTLIVSGVEAHEAEGVSAALLGAGCRVIERIEEASWVAFLTNPISSTMQ